MSEEEEFQSVLETALGLVHGDRMEDYGHPIESFERTAMYWTVALGVTISPEQIPILMMLHKISREQTKPKRDNRVDIAGYSETLEQIIDELSRRVSQGTE